MYAVSCTNPDAPVMPAAGIVLRIIPAGSGDALAPAAAAAFDSVAVRVFRGGTPLQQEAHTGVPVGVDPVEIRVACVAEAGKRVSVELFLNGVMEYAGAAEDVTVKVGAATDVVVDALPFVVPSLSATPDVVDDGTAFSLAWPAAAGAESYVTQASRTPDFATIEWTQTAADTVASAQLGPGTHYFRVAPRTPYATGTFAGPEFGYVLGGSRQVVVTGFSAAGVIPGETVTVLGENLDYPGTQAAVGADELEILSAAWDELVVRVPRGARSGYVSAGSALGVDISDDPLVVQRIAYVTTGGEFAGSFAGLMGVHGDDVEYSGTAVLLTPQLDTRDMSVFDVIVIANDTGTSTSDWGGGIGARVDAVTASGANVLAMGDGGAAFVQLAASSLAGTTLRVTSQTSCYASRPSAAVFTTPHAVTGGVLPEWVDVCKNPERAVALEINSFAKPTGVSLYATSAIGNDRWVMADAVFAAGPGTVRYLFWGFSADPNGFTTDGKDCLANAVTLLYKEHGAVTPAASR